MDEAGVENAPGMQMGSYPSGQQRLSTLQSKNRSAKTVQLDMKKAPLMGCSWMIFVLCWINTTVAFHTWRNASRRVKPLGFKLNARLMQPAHDWQLCRRLGHCCCVCEGTSLMKRTTVSLLILFVALVQTSTALAQENTDASSQAPTAYVTLNLAAGFPLDPFFVSVNGGGEVDASTLASGCTGYVNTEPTVTLNWTGEA